MAAASASKSYGPSKSYQMVDFGLPNGGISKYSTTIMNEKKAILEDRRKTPEAPSSYHKRSADPSKYYKPSSSYSTQSVNLGLPNGGISKYTTSIKNEKVAILADRRKTPGPSSYHKRSAEPSKYYKPKKSESTVSVDFGLPNGGISKYSTTILNEKKAILEDRRKTPEAPSSYHKRSADPSYKPPAPKPKLVYGYHPKGGLSAVSRSKQGVKGKRSAEPSGATSYQMVQLGDSEYEVKIQHPYTKPKKAY